MFVGDIDAPCGGLPLVIVHEIAGDRGDAELGTRKRRAGRAVLLLDDQGTLFLVEKGERLRRAALDEDALGGAVQHKAADRLCFPRRDRCAGDKPGDGNAPVFVGDVVAACLPDHRAGAVCHMERDARNRRGRARDVLLQGKRLHRVVEEGQRLSVIGLDNDGLCAGALVDGIARDGLGFRDHQRTRDAGDRDSAVGVGGIKPVGGQLAVLGIHHATIRVCHLELDARQRRFRHGIELLNGQRTFALVPERQLLDFALPNQNILRVPVEDKSVHGLDLPRGDGRTRLQTVQHDFSGLVCVIHTVVGADRRAAAVDQLERDARQRFIRRTLDVFPNNERSCRLIIYREGICHARPNDDALGGVILDIALGGAGFRDNHGGVGL